MLLHATSRADTVHVQATELMLKLVYVAAVLVWYIYFIHTH